MFKSFHTFIVKYSHNVCDEIICFGIWLLPSNCNWCPLLSNKSRVIYKFDISFPSFLSLLRKSSMLLFCSNIALDNTVNIAKMSTLKWKNHLLQSFFIYIQKNICSNSIDTLVVVDELGIAFSMILVTLKWVWEKIVRYAVGISGTCHIVS